MIPVHSPDIGAREAELVAQALREGAISGSGGRFLAEFEDRLADYFGVGHAIAVSSGTAALQLAAALMDVRPGDEILVSASTNIATVVGIAERGGRVVPVDVEPDTWNMNVALLRGLLTPRTRGVLPVHLYGHPVEMVPVLEFAEENSLFVVEDAAEAMGAQYLGGFAGALGDLGCLSFYANKVITTGEGGALLTNRHDLDIRARSLRNLAFGHPRFLHRELGYNYRMTNLQAALGCAQMEQLERIIADKRYLARRYSERLAGTPGLQLPVEREWARSVYWMYSIVVDSSEFGITRDELARRLAADEVDTRTMFCPLNLQPALLERGAVDPRPCPVAEALWRDGLYLPSDHRLDDAAVDYICEAIQRARR